MKTGLGAQRREPLPRVQRCATKGCGNPTFDCPYCERCDEEVRALEAMRIEKEHKQRQAIERHWRRQEWIGTARRWVQWVGDAALMVLVGLGTAYVGWHLWLMFIAWRMGWQ